MGLMNQVLIDVISLVSSRRLIISTVSTSLSAYEHHKAERTEVRIKFNNPRTDNNVVAERMTYITAGTK